MDTHVQRKTEVGETESRTQNWDSRLEFQWNWAFRIGICAYRKTKVKPLFTLCLAKD